MWLAIAGMRANEGRFGWSNLSRRQAAWLPFDLESYRKGHLDFSIQDRGVVLPTPEEAVNLVILKETIQTEWGMREVGIPEDDIKSTVRERKKAAEQQAAMFSVANAGGEGPDAEQDQSREDENQPLDRAQ
jgi:hypothetical protein